MTIVILCAGESKRFTWEGMSKFHLPVFRGEQLLNRTVKQCYETAPPFVITHNVDVLQGLRRYGYDAMFHWYSPEAHAYTCQTLQSTDSLWGSGQVTVLLGDTLYSTGVMNNILENRSRFVFYGDASEREIYALTFNDHNQLLWALNKVDERVSLGYHGQLWQLFYVLNNLPAHRHPQTLPYQVFRNVMDFTQDFDTVEDYEKFVEEFDPLVKVDPFGV